MAQKYVDLAITTDKSSAVATGRQDGSSLTLTNDVRIIFDDTLDSNALSVLIDRARDVILETTA